MSSAFYMYSHSEWNYFLYSVETVKILKNGVPLNFFIQVQYSILANSNAMLGLNSPTFLPTENIINDNGG